jgi:CheY-like chemotaxis protein
MKAQNPAILFVDDSEDDQLLVVRAFRRAGITVPINCVSSGNQAIAYLKGERKFSDRSIFPYPSLIITDLKMPNGDGFSVLQHLKSKPEWKIIPTIILSASQDLDDIKKAYMLGASSYLVKPTPFPDLQNLLKVVFDYWARCEVPEIDVTGKQLPTEGKGKIGERISQHS